MINDDGEVVNKYCYYNIFASLTWTWQELQSNSVVNIVLRHSASEVAKQTKH